MVLFEIRQGLKGHFLNKFRVLFKDTHREKAPSNRTPTLRKSTNMAVWAVGILNPLFIRGS